ncbi:uncharacterized protein [Garra rufa]|uniref:uncharacterized protein n=1 Tax=Garra rufa TaxID=137080 RepID=UPI003CCE71D9
MGSNQSVLEKNGYTLMSEQDKKIMVKNKVGDQFVIKKLKAGQKDASNFLQQIKHPHIVHYKEIIEDRGCSYLVMELCEGKDFSQKIQEKKEVNFNFTHLQILDWIVKICMALKHLHDQEILHRNLQPKSLFFTACETIRLGEFGQIREWSSEAQTSNTESVSYVAPEILRGETYDEKSEVWNLGCIIYEMCMQKCAFAGKSTVDIIPKILNSSYEALPETFSEDLHQLVKDTLETNPADRPSVSEILMRPFIVNHLFKMSKKTVKELISKVSLKVLEELADGLESFHFRTTVGSLAGGVVGLAGGITSIVGLILTPFTLGASLIVTGVGIGVAVAGGAASGASNLAKMYNQRSSRQNVKMLITEIQERITSTSYCIQNIHIAVETQKLLSEGNRTWSNAQSGENTFLRAGARLGRGLGGIAELIRLTQVSGVGRIAAQTARVVRVAEVATGVLTGLFVAVDVFFIALDSREIHRLRRDYNATNRNEQELQSELMKFVQKIRETKEELKKILDELKVELQTLEPQIQN